MKRAIFGFCAASCLVVGNLALAGSPPADLLNALGPVPAQTYMNLEAWCDKDVSSDPAMPGRDCGPFEFATPVPFVLRGLSLVPTGASDASIPERHDTLCTAYVYLAESGDFGAARMLGQFSWNGDDHTAAQLTFPVPLSLPPGSYALQISMQAFGQPSGTTPPSRCSVYGRLFYTMP
jgi:hypothetical protein